MHLGRKKTSSKKTHRKTPLTTLGLDQAALASLSLSNPADLFGGDDFGDRESQLSKKGIYLISGRINRSSILPVQQDLILKTLNPAWQDNLQIIINSHGGSVTWMWSLIDLMEWSRLEIRTVGIGECESAAAAILAAGTKGKRVAAKNLSIMIHEHAWGWEGKYSDLVAASRGSHQEHERDLRFWTQHSKYTTPEEVRKFLMQEKDHWMTAEEALEHGIVDYISDGT